MAQPFAIVIFFIFWDKIYCLIVGVILFIILNLFMGIYVNFVFKYTNSKILYILGLNQIKFIMSTKKSFEKKFILQNYKPEIDSLRAIAVKEFFYNIFIFSILFHVFFKYFFKIC